MSPMVDPRRLLQEGNTQSKQLMQGPVAPLTWQYPLMPEEPLLPEVPFELRTPSPSVSVAARCEDYFVQVEVKKVFYGNGQLVNPAFLSLGGCGAVGEDPDAQILIFESELQTCGISLTMTADELVYTFTLRYTPEAVGGTPIVRAAAVAIACHYPRCMVDAKLTGSPSQFMRRVQNDKLQFQLEAFRFQQTGSGSVYVTCALKAVIASALTNPESKACSFANGWTSADENDQVCMCCDATCGSSRKGRSLSDSVTILMWVFFLTFGLVRL
ncbi:egg envelope glycoprotein ZP3 [Triplophysa rosa]|uniref:Zona pellucida sperm-binding protein 3 n=1 Tax=Triplophysa rosa TaxID=992332 RepID=A0A9W7TME2_TRIRA|nr:egg envelope glycoprotein ZP3 [Triplophysa rosa]